MGDSFSIYFLIIGVSLVFCAFFSAMEIAFLSSNRLKVELDRQKGTFNGRILGVFYTKESFFIALLLLGNNITLVLFGIYAALTLEPVIQNWGITEPTAVLLLQTLISTLVVLSLSEFLPKALVQLNPNGFLKFATAPMFLIYLVLYLPTHLVMGASSFFLRLLKTDHKNSAKVFSKIDLEHFVNDISNRIKNDEEIGNEVEILQNALDFSAIKARDCMVPRTEIEAIDIEETIDQLKSVFLATGYSKIIVYRSSIDNIIGYVHSFELFKKPESIKQILLPLPFVPAAMPGKELMELFAKQSGNIAVVVDEYGGTAGLVTLEDVIEEIFGEIDDEHDLEELLEEQVSDGEFRFSARHAIDYLNKTYDFQLPESEEYETLGGLIIHQLESIPDKGDQVEIDDKLIIIEEVSDRRIEIVRIVNE